MVAWLAWISPFRRGFAGWRFVFRAFSDTRTLIVSSLVILFLTGCLVKSGPREDETTMDMRHIARVFESIQGFYNRPPKDLEEIKKYLTDYHTDGLNEPADKVLTSSRDGEPYVIIIGSQFGTGMGDEIVMYEKRGAEGKRYVMFTDRSVRQLTDDEFKQATFAKGHRPESS
jgi:hypothetical protein